MIVHSDAFVWISNQKDSSADLLIADPPYEIWDEHIDFVDEAVRVSHNVLLFTQQPFDFKLLERSQKWLRRKIVWAPIPRWVSNNLPRLGFHEIYWLSKYKKPFFNRRSGLPYSKTTQDGYRGEMVFDGYSKPQKPFVKHPDGTHLPDTIIMDKPRNKKLNVRSKPQKLMSALVRCFCPDGGIVYDPFAGMGTVAVACKEQGKKYVGVELDKSLVQYVRGIE